jgi:hypothetical protein
LDQARIHAGDGNSANSYQRPETSKSRDAIAPKVSAIQVHGDSQPTDDRHQTKTGHYLGRIVNILDFRFWILDSPPPRQSDFPASDFDLSETRNPKSKTF